MDIKKEVKPENKSVALFLTGAALGAAAALLLAPDSGKETRRKMGQWLKEKREKGKEGLLARKEAMADALEAGKKAYREVEKKHLAGV